MRSTRSMLAWVSLAAVLLAVVGFLATTALDRRARISPAARAARLEAIVRCPSCIDLSVAQSDDPSSVALRAEIARLVRAGLSDQRIERALEARFGPSILLAPPRQGVDLVVWVLPPLVLAACVGGAVGVLLARRRRAGACAAPAHVAVADGVGRELRAGARPVAGAELLRTSHGASPKPARAVHGTSLEQERASREQERVSHGASGEPERAAQDGSAEPNRGSHDARAAAGRASLPRRARLVAGRPRGFVWAGRAAGIVLVAAGGALAVLQPWQAKSAASAPASEAQAHEGSVAALVAQGERFERRGNLLGALRAYEAALRRDPRQPVALAESGWIEYEAGVAAGDSVLEAQGRAGIEAAVAIAPRFAPARLFLGTVLLRSGDAAAAVAQYRAFLADRPSNALVLEARPFIEQAYKAAGLAPPALPADRAPRP
jgi:cytochrome c-type biogenesis protein CcmH